MEVLGFNLVDLIVIAVILLSGIFALARGFVKEVLAIFSWVGAAFATLYGFTPASGFARQFIQSPVIADAAAGATLFLGTLFILSLISGLISRRVRGSSVGSVDRSLGFVFGLLRGFVLISIAYLALSWALPPTEQPKWVRAAKTMPLMERGAAILSVFAPSHLRYEPPPNQPAGANEGRAVRVAPDSSTVNPLSAGGGPGYKAEERKEMDRLIQGTQ
jgi:membrane protein required for colicin V production